jgi:hypothetical protein
VTYQVVEHTLVQRPLPFPALPQLLVAVVQAFPVLAELSQAVLVDVLQPDLQSEKAPDFSDFSLVGPASLFRLPGIRTRWRRIL